MTNKSTTKKRRSQPVQTVRRMIPSHYPKAPGDTMVMPFKVTNLLTLPASTPTVTKLIVLGNGTSTGDYIFLNDLSSPFKANVLITSRWMITDLKVEVRATGVGGTANTFIAASYIPSNSSLDNPPTTLGEVSQAMHYGESSLGTVGNFKVQPTDYFNDWRQTQDADDSDAQAGLIQIYGSGVQQSGVSTVGVYTISGVLHFCGLRF